MNTTQGFVVRAGSFAAKDHTPSLQEHSPAVVDLRSQLIQNGVLQEEKGMLRFTQDYTFSSPSMASSVVLGRASNGRTDWKDPGGRTLKALQEAEAAK